MTKDYLLIVTFLFCPNRWTRSCACNSNCGFQWGSTKKTWFPPVRFRPTPPAMRESKQMWYFSGYLLNFFMLSVRSAVFSLPVMKRQENRREHKCWLRMSSVVVHEETITTLSMGRFSALASALNVSISSKIWEKNIHICIQNRTMHAHE